jgi:mannan endo-1,4-beta-mannosidase
MNTIRFLGVLLLLLIILTMMFRPQTQEQNPAHFVIVKGQDFYLQDKQFRSIGINRYNILTHNTQGGNQVGCANPFTEAQLDTMFANLQSKGVTTVRFWAFQSFTKSGKDMSRLDYVVAIAEKYNIKLIPVFENHWQDCTEEGEKSKQWYTSGYQSAYGSYPLSLKQYISAIVPRYKDNPTILAWEIINEPRDVDEQTLYQFAKDISQHIKSVDENHLVSIGMAGAYSSDELYERVYNLSTIDYIDYHDYDFEQDSLPTPLAERMTLAKRLNKPFVIGESGVQSTIENREQLFEEKMQAFFKERGSVYLIWSYGDAYITNDGFNFMPDDAVSHVVDRNAAELKK